MTSDASSSVEIARLLVALGDGVRRRVSTAKIVDTAPVSPNTAMRSSCLQVLFGRKQHEAAEKKRQAMQAAHDALSGVGGNGADRGQGPAGLDAELSPHKPLQMLQVRARLDPETRSFSPCGRVESSWDVWPMVLSRALDGLRPVSFDSLGMFSHAFAHRVLCGKFPPSLGSFCR